MRRSAAMRRKRSDKRPGPAGETRAVRRVAILTLLFVGVLAGTAALLMPVNNAGGAEGAAAVPAAPAAAAVSGATARPIDRPLMARTRPAPAIATPVPAGPTIGVPPLLAAPPSAGAKPIVHTENIEHDFGDQWAGPDLKHAFTVRNRGDAPLEITKIDARCGCTVAGPYPKLLQPGESGDVPFTLKTVGLQGPFNKSVGIHTNDPVTPVLNLRLRGTAKRRVEVMPPSATFGTLTGSEPVERVVKIKNNTETPLELKINPVADGQVKFELAEKVPGQEFELRATAMPPFKPGMLAVNAMIETNIAEEKSVQVRAVGRVPERLDLYPSTLTYVAPANAQVTAQNQSRWLWLNNYGDKPVNVVEATADDPALKVSFIKQALPAQAATQPAVRKPGQPLESYRIQIDLPAGYNPPPTGRTIVVKTDDPEKAVLEAKLMGSPTAQAPQTPRPPVKRPAELMVNQQAPAFRLQTLDGQSVSNEDLAGGISVLNFVAPNCGFCKKQLPIVESVRGEYEQQGIRFLNVVQKMGKEFTPEETKQVLDSVGSKLALAMDSGNAVGQAFKATSYPTLFVVAKDAKIAYVDIGSNQVMQLKSQLDGLISGKPVPQAETAATPPPAPAVPQKRPAEELVGQAAPAFKLETTAGSSIASEDLTKHVTVLNFIAPNCGFCRKQIPLVEAARVDYAGAGVRFVNVSERMGQKEYTSDEVKQVMDSLGSKLELALDGKNEVGRSFKAMSYPTMFVIGKDGKIAHVNVGSNTAAQLGSQLDKILKGSPAASTRPAIQVGG